MTRQIALVGCGAIGGSLLEQLQGDEALRVTQVVVPPAFAAAARAVCASWAPHAQVRERLDLDGALRPDLVVECAGHAAVGEHVLPALRKGIVCVVASIGALHDAAALAQLEDAAREGRTQAHLIPGAVGAIDALAAARLGGLSSVQYIGRKPPSAWSGTPAESRCDLAALQEPFTIFEGTAREAARLYPKNANVAATVSLAGLGLDATRATLIADPAVTRNVHQVLAEGAFGKLDLRIENEALRANPKTSALTVFSLLRAIHNATRPLTL